MIPYNVDKRGNGRVGPCKWAGLRASIIGICKRQGWEIPPAALDEATDKEALRDINLLLQYRRAQVRRAEADAEAAARRIEEAARLSRLPADVAARVADLRQKAARTRTAAAFADRIADLQSELAEATRMEEEAYRLITSHLDQAA